jgi:diacylglycerol O-acyltransferase / wax synthase
MAIVHARQMILAAPEAIFRRISDPGEFPALLCGVARWELLEGAGPAKGARYLVLLRIGSAEAGGVVRITEYEPPRAIGWSSERGVQQRGRVELTSKGAGTEVAVELDFEVPGIRPIAWAVEHVVSRQIERRLRASLMGLRRRIEFDDGPGAIQPGAADQGDGNADGLPSAPSAHVQTPPAKSAVFTPVDAAWLRMDGPNHPMTITALLTLDQPLPYEDLIQLLEERLLRESRFSEKVVDFKLPGRLPRWEPDPLFDLRRHVRRTRLAAPGDTGALENLVSELISTPLERNKPLWQVDLVERFGSGSALIVRLHHCIGDGVALIGLMLSVIDEGAFLSPQVVGVSAPAAHGLDHIRHAGEQAFALGRNLILSKDPKTPFKGRLGPRKRATWSKPVVLADVKAIAHSLKATVNDVLAAAVTGALRAYLDEHDAWVEDLEIRALVPVYVRGQTSAGIGNHFGMVFVDLPLGITDPIERVKEVNRRFDVLKHSPDATAALWLLGALAVASGPIERTAVDLFTTKATVTMTNVPGPPAPVHLAGRVLGSMMMWAPVSGRLGVGLSLLSYAGAVKLGVAADAGLVSDPAAIVRSFEAEIAALKAACSAQPLAFDLAKGKAIH